jgi:hypothetical protein
MNNNSGKTSSNENGHPSNNEKGGNVGMINMPTGSSSSSSAVHEGGLRLGIAGNGEGSSHHRKNKSTTMGGTSFDMGVAGDHRYGNDDITANLSPNNEAYTTTTTTTANNSRLPPFGKQSIHPTTQHGDDDHNHPIGSSTSLSGGEGGFILSFMLSINYLY